jgi:ADP-ribose pyrophosphatase YjhB (NUDIX family)
MYKVFFNRKPVMLITELVKVTDQTPLFFIKYSNPPSIVKALKSKSVRGIYLYHSNPEKLWKHLLKHFPLIEAGGGVVQHQNGKILFIYRNNKWDLPKGRIEKKEMLLDGALREVMEETGVKDLIVKKKLSDTYHIFSRNGKYKLKKTYWYLMHTSYEGVLEPQLDEGIQMATWKNKEEISELMENAYENIKLILSEIGLY